MYTHTILVPKILKFIPEYARCPHCHKSIEKHINCEGARFHIHYYSGGKAHCSIPNCEDNHGPNRCVRRQDRLPGGNLRSE